MPSSLVETRPLESLVFPSQQPGQDSSDSHRAATSTNKCLFSTHQCTLVKVEKLAMSGWKEWSVNSCYTFCLFVSFLLGALERKRREVGNGNMVFEYWLQGSVCMFVCVCVENGGGGCPGLFSRICFYGCLVIRHISGMLFCFMIKMRFQGVG